MFRTCNGCKAFSIVRHEADCSLGYRQEQVYKMEILVSARPLEECDKPRTNSELIVAHNKNIEHLN